MLFMGQHRGVIPLSSQNAIGERGFAPMRMLLVWVGLGLLAVVLIAYSWIGFLGSDDLAYVDTATQWINTPPVVPAHHWGLRHTLTLPLAAAFATLGEAEWVGSAVSLAYLAALLTIVAVVTRQVTSWTTAQIAVGLSILTPLTLEFASIIGVDLVEAFLVLASFLAFWRAAMRGGDRTLLFVAGVLAGLAFINRETAVALLAWFGVVFLFGFYIPRLRHVIMGAGFLLVIGAEMAYYAVVADTPFLRFEIALGTIDNRAPTDPGTGNITTNRWLGPPASLLFNNEFGLLFWLAIPAAILIIRRFSSAEPVGSMARALSGLAIAWFVVVGYCLDLRALPRYFAVAVFCANIVLAIAVGQILWPRWRKVAIAATLLFVGSSLLLVDLSNRDPRSAERVLVNVVRAHPQTPIWTDPRTYWRSTQLLTWANTTDERVQTDRPRNGGLYVYFRPSASQDEFKGQPVDASVYAPDRSWEVVARHPPARTGIGSLLSLIGLGPSAGLLPRRVYYANPDVIVYRVPPVLPQAAR